MSNTTDEIDDQLDSLQSYLINSIKSHANSLLLNPVQVSHFVELIVDKCLLYRFLKKAKLNIESTQQNLLNHIDWRLQHETHSICFENLSEPSLSQLQANLFVFWRTDIFGRPVLLLRPSAYDGNAEAIVDTLVFVLEVLRRWMCQLTRIQEHHHDIGIYQVTLVLDVQGFSLSQMDYGLISVFYELFHSHFPSFFVQALVLNYGWIHASIWQVLKSVMSSGAQKKIAFLSRVENLSEYIPKNYIPPEYGGASQPMPETPDLCPTILSYGSRVPIITHSSDHVVLMEQILQSNSYMSPVLSPSIPMTSPDLALLDNATTDQSQIPLRLSSPQQARFQYAPITYQALDESARSSKGSYIDRQRIRSAADLQELLHNDMLRTESGLSRNSSTVSLTKLVGLKPFGMSSSNGKSRLVYHRVSPPISRRGVSDRGNGKSFSDLARFLFRHLIILPYTTFSFAINFLFRLITSVYPFHYLIRHQAPPAPTRSSPVPSSKSKYPWNWLRIIMSKSASSTFFRMSSFIFVLYTLYLVSKRTALLDLILYRVK